MINNEMTIKEFENYCKEFFLKLHPIGLSIKLTFDQWIESLKKTEKILNK